MSRDPRLAALIARLRPPTPPEERAFAARALSQSSKLPAWCAEPLIAALEDDASYSEEWTDGGFVVGGATYTVRQSATEAIRQMGGEAIEALSTRPDLQSWLARAVAAASPEELERLPAELRARLPRLVSGAVQERDALKALAFRDAAGDEASRLIARLSHQTAFVVADACEALARLPATQAIADAVFSRLSSEPELGEHEERATRGLEALAPLVSDAVMERFLAVRLGPRVDPRTPVLRAVLAWGPRARSASAALMDLLLKKLRGSEVSMNATLPAMVVAAVIGPPTSAEDLRVKTFLTVRQKLRGVEQPPPDVLTALVKSCGGPHHVSGFVLDELTQRLIDGPNAARADAVPRLLPLREAAEPAGEALLIALDAFIAAGWTMSISDTCWTLAFAGAANQRALQKFIAMLDTAYVADALHGLHGMAESAGEAIPALEALLARSTGHDVQRVEAVLKRVRYYNKV